MLAALVKGNSESNREESEECKEEEVAVRKKIQKTRKHKKLLQEEDKLHLDLNESDKFRADEGETNCNGKKAYNGNKEYEKRVQTKDDFLIEKSVLVENLDESTTSVDLYKSFEIFGEIVKTSILRDAVGWGYIQFTTAYIVQKAFNASTIIINGIPAQIVKMSSDVLDTIKTSKNFRNRDTGQQSSNLRNINSRGRPWHHPFSTGGNLTNKGFLREQHKKFSNGKNFNNRGKADRARYTF